MLGLPDFREKSIVICFASDGQKVAFKNDNLVVKDENDKIVLQITCHRIFSLWIIGRTIVTSGLLERSKKFAFSVYLLSYSHRLYGLWSSSVEGNFLLRRKQYAYEGVDIAKHLVQNKIVNQSALLKKLRTKTVEIKEAIEKMNGYAKQVNEMQDLQDLLGIEGVASRLFFGHWYGDLGWRGRKPRTKIDAINALLDIGYTYLFNLVECMLNLYGFDLYQGFYHRCFYQRKSLVCDIVEPFRCIVDRQVRKAYKLKQFQFEDFEERKGQYFLKIEKNKEYTRWLVQGLLEHKEAIFLYTQDFYRSFMKNRPISEYPVFRLDG
ncbi:MAG TPA: type V CRISPR-associated endonuclease Cas1 [Turneriella sp.]|nr:type V CRISPR-associated endonuclease Cas1 [Turneriella sp.]